MEQQRQPSHYEIFRQKVVDALTEKVLNDYADEFMLVTLDTLVPDHAADTQQFHPDTLRGLCIYASVAAGENTNMAIGYTPMRMNITEDCTSAYSRPLEEARYHEFLVRPLPPKLEQKTTPTHEPVTEVDQRRRNSLKDGNVSGSSTDYSQVHIPNGQRGRKKTQIPGFVSRMTDRFGF